jgi:hypothetical protein
MPCEVIDIPGGGQAIIRRSRRPVCQFCKQREHTKLCDYKITVGSVGCSRTCDAKMCDQCAKNVGVDLDYCPDHKEEVPR